jgi:hypothetical protein
MSHRQGETDRPHFRTERIVQVNDRWYFLTRESEEPIGPFGSYNGAEKVVRDYLKDLEQYPDPTLMYRTIPH